MGGLIRARALAGSAVAIPRAVAGRHPPLSGFWAKFVLVEASLDARAPGSPPAWRCSPACSLLSMSKIWNEAFRPGRRGRDAGAGAGATKQGSLRSAGWLRPALWAVGARWRR